MIEKDNETWFRRNRVGLLIVVGGFAAMNAIFLTDAFRGADSASAEGAGQLGDFVGGYVGTLFVLLSVWLLYATLHSQRVAQQLQSFEARFFELIKMHRDNVAEVQLGEAHGRRVFIKIYSELLAAMEIARSSVEGLGIRIEQRALLKLAYYCVFYGVGPNSSRMLRHALGDIDEALVDEMDWKLQDADVCERVCKEYAIGYRPFRGHQSRLGHYYRHLYQSVRYVDQQKISIDKYDYVKTLRAQLTTHEQALLLVNSLTPVGFNWWKQNLILDYRMVKNLPKHFFDPLLDLEAPRLFPKGYFEWEEVHPRSSAAAGARLPG
ncbi:MAG TPA: putative phage abortive infection protein [Steroidobacter sp.]|uniref:putative phage abortive infection protein n=1 Tax=Steroidobacter sp. TaxID=1978227 RepID=UPI002ED8F026